jgi:hypothetical protein
MFALVPVVTALGPEGGLSAVARAWRILRADPARTFVPVAAAQVIVRAPLIIAFLLLRPEGASLVALLFRAWLITALPFVTLVALAVFEAATPTHRDPS